MFKEMARVVKECVKHPGRQSIWSERLGKYVCDHDAEFPAALDDYARGKSATNLPIDPTFKLIFLTAAGGTLLFTLICVTIHLAQGQAMPPATEKLVSSMLDMAKVGFGAVVGLLGGQVMKSGGSRRSRGQATG